MVEKVERKESTNPLDQFSDLVPSNGFEDLLAPTPSPAPTQAASPFKTEPQKTETVIFGEQEAEVPPANDFDDEIPF